MLMLALVLQVFALGQGGVGGPIPVAPGMLEAAPWVDELRLAADFEALEFGDLDADGRLDAVVRTGSAVVFLPWIEVATAPLQVGSAGTIGTVLGSALLEAPGGASQAVACVGPVGLSVMAWDAASEGFVLVNSVGGVWIGATEVLAADVDGDGIEDLVGLSSTGTEALVLLRNANGSFSVGPTIALLAPASGLTAVQWLPDAELEIACLTAGALEVFDGDSSLLASFPLAGPEAAVIVVNGGVGLEGLALFSGPDGAGHSYLETFDQTGALATLPIEGCVASQLAAGDIDADGDLDLALTFLDHSSMLLLECSGVGLFAGWSEWVAGTMQTGLVGDAGHVARPAFGDVDHDGRLDLGLPSVSDGALLLATELAHTPASDFKGWLPMVSPSFCQAQGGGGAKFVPRFAFDDGGLVTDFELAVWLQWDEPFFVQPTAILSQKIARTPDGIGGFDSAVEPTILLASQRAGWGFDPRDFTITLTPLDASGERVGPTLVGVFSPESLHQQWLGGNFAWGQPVGVDTALLCSGLPGSGTSTGAWIRSKRIPPFPPRSMPKK